MIPLPTNVKNVEKNLSFLKKDRNIKCRFIVAVLRWQKAARNRHQSFIKENERTHQLSPGF